MHKSKMTRKQAQSMMAKAARKAKQIRKPKEKYQTAVKRAYRQMK